MHLASVPVSGSHVCVHTYKHSHSGHCVHLWITRACAHTYKHSFWTLPISGSHMYVHTYKHSHSGHCVLWITRVCAHIHSDSPVFASSDPHAGLTCPHRATGMCTPSLLAQEWVVCCRVQLAQSPGLSGLLTVPVFPTPVPSLLPSAWRSPVPHVESWLRAESNV